MFLSRCYLARKERGAVGRATDLPTCVLFRVKAASFLPVDGITCLKWLETGMAVSRDRSSSWAI